MRGGGERSRQRKSMCECWAKLWLAGSRSAWSIGRPERAFQDEAGTYGQKTACRSHGVRQLFHLYPVVGKKQSADLKQRTRCDQVCVRRRVCFKTTQHSGHTVFEAGRSRQELCTSRLWPGLGEMKRQFRGWANGTMGVTGWRKGAKWKLPQGCAVKWSRGFGFTKPLFTVFSFKNNLLWKTLSICKGER